MDNQHRHIKGYRDLSQAEIDLMNEIKAKGAELEALCAKVKSHIATQYNAAKKDDPEGIAAHPELARLIQADPLHWEHWARGSFQSGLMYLTRAVAQPASF